MLYLYNIVHAINLTTAAVLEWSLRSINVKLIFVEAEWKQAYYNYVWLYVCIANRTTCNTYRELFHTIWPYGFICCFYCTQFTNVYICITTWCSFMCTRSWVRFCCVYNFIGHSMWGLSIYLLLYPMCTGTRGPGSAGHERTAHGQGVSTAYYLAC